MKNAQKVSIFPTFGAACVLFKSCILIMNWHLHDIYEYTFQTNLIKYIYSLNKYDLVW